MSFKDLRGQESQITLLRNAIEKDRLSHAYLFFGKNPALAGKKGSPDALRKW
jgi:DNA polymerase III gamma/tau subunit